MSELIKPRPGTIVIFSDIGCPWAHLAVFRLHTWRARMGKQDSVRSVHHAFPLELLNEEPTPRKILDAEIPVAGGADPEAGWQLWQRPDSEWPVTTLPAMEAVAALRESDPEGSELLDRALRVALFGQSRCISMHHEILAVADEVGLDVKTLDEALRDGEFRRSIFEDLTVADGPQVDGSPHLFLSDGSDFHNPGIEMHWEGGHGRGFPVIDKDDPSIFEEIIERAAS